MSWNFANLMTVVTLVATIAIPVAIWVADSRSGDRLEQLQKLQAESLDSQARLQRQLRRDAIMDRAATTQQASLLRILWSEVEQFDGDDRRLLQATFRQNPCVRLPGAHRGVDLRDVLDAEAVHDYVQSLEGRYSSRGYEFHGLLHFLEEVGLKRLPLADEDLVVLASTLTSDCAVAQRPSHWWYLDVVKAAPALAPKLLANVGRIRDDAGAIRMDALSGILEGILAVRDREVLITHDELRALRYEVANSLTMALERDLSSINVESRYDQTRDTPTTVATLVEVAGWAGGAYHHLGMRMMESLPKVIRSVPECDRPWGPGASQIRAGFAAMESSWPDHWADNCEQLEAAADLVGPWRASSRDVAAPPG